MMSDDKVTVRTRWCVVVVVMLVVVAEVVSQGSNMCMVKQKYNITKRVKYRAPMAVRTYEWCFAVPPRCSKWTTEMRDLTKLETEERTADVAVCCPGYKMQDGLCVVICHFGKTGPKCSNGCPEKKWGPNCANDCKNCEHGSCSPVSGECQCHHGWQGERCETISPATTTVVMEELLTTNKSTPKLSAELPTKPTTSASTTSRPPLTSTSTTPSTTTVRRSTTETLQTKPPIIHYTTEKITTTIPTSTVVKYENESLTTETRSNVLMTTTPTWTQTSTKATTSTKLNMMTTPTPISATQVDIEAKTKKFNQIQQHYNRTETPVTAVTDISKEPVKVVIVNNKTKDLTSKTTMPPEKLSSKVAISTKESYNSNQATKEPETTVPTSSTTKFKPKEIWIKPAQKGESTIVEIKTKQNMESSQHRLRTLKKEPSTMTTPRTIIVSIIPTSVSYTSFKKIALSTTSYVPVKNQFLSKFFNKSIDLATDKSLSPPTTITTFTTAAKKKSTPLSAWNQNISTTNHIKSPTNKSVTNAPPTKEPHLKTTKLSLRNNTNSMLKVMNAVDKISKLTTVSANASNISVFTKDVFTTLKSITQKPQVLSQTKAAMVTEHKPTSRPLQQATSKSSINSTSNPITELPINKIAIVKNEKPTNDTKRNGSSNESTITVTNNPIASEETFNILTEPEHITAVMGEKETARSSADLISVLGIAGGVMMAVITLATVIVMMERCRRPRYEDIRKMNEMRMQVYLDENDVPPPPYVRSIFHTPLPDPPIAEKCHYQPISTLDRNVKQFMRPVVVQTISPIMLENFRGILECHYDHLPLRNNTIPQEERTTPSIDRCQDYNDLRAHSLADSTIEALKCEARLESIDSTTSEPLYAEIPCWRPPSEHAIEIVNLNGEAMTEL